MEVPAAISDYLSKFRDPVALVGCRCTGLAMDSCEYDLLVLSPQALPPRIDTIGRYTIELFHSAGVPSPSAEMIQVRMLKDPEQSFHPFSSEEWTKRSLKILNMAGRKSLVKSLMMQKRSQDSDRDPAVSAAWLKASAFCLTRGLLQISGTRAMPTHELDQLRELNQNRNTTTDIETGLDAIGLDYANRHSIERSKKAVSELIADRYDKKLIMEKAEGLEQKQKLADAYYYLCRITCNLFEADEELLLTFPRIIQIALGVSSDQNQIQKLRTRLFKAASFALKR